MADSDFSELVALQMDLEKVTKNSGPHIRKALDATAFDVKEDARKRVSGRTLMGHAASAIDYELKGFQGFGATVLDAEIGYDKHKRGGALGNLIEFGAPRAKKFIMVRKGVWVPAPGKPSKPLPPGSELQQALTVNESNFEDRIDAAIDDALAEAGL